MVLPAHKTNLERAVENQRLEAIISMPSKVFLGVNMDAIETAGQFGIGADRAVNYQCDSEETALNYEVVSEAIRSV